MLYKNKERKWFTGLMAGLADYLGINVYFLRLVAAMFTALMFPVLMFVLIWIYYSWSNQLMYKEDVQSEENNDKNNDGIIETKTSETPIKKLSTFVEKENIYRNDDEI